MTTNVLLRDLDLVLPEVAPGDGRRLEVVVDGLPCLVAPNWPLTPPSLVHGGRTANPLHEQLLRTEPGLREPGDAKKPRTWNLSADTLGHAWLCWVSRWEEDFPWRHSPS